LVFSGSCFERILLALVASFSVMAVVSSTTLQESHYSQGIGFASYSPATQEEQDYWTLEWWYKKGPWMHGLLF
jgi:hypothetical protein